MSNVDYDEDVILDDGDDLNTDMLYMGGFKISVQFMSLEVSDQTIIPTALVFFLLDKTLWCKYFTLHEMLKYISAVRKWPVQLEARKEGAWFCCALSLDCIENTMAPTRKLTSTQKKEKKAALARARRERIKANPQLLAIEREKERRKYNKKKQEGKVKLVANMSNRERRAARRMWNEKWSRRVQRKLKRETEQQFLVANTPEDSDEDERPQQRALQSSEKKKFKKFGMIWYRRTKALKKQFVEEEKAKNKWRKRFFRLKQQVEGANKNSPRKIVKKVMESGNKMEIRRRLLFGEALKRGMSINFQNLFLKGDKVQFGKLLVGNGEILKRYKLLSNVRTISHKVFDKKHRTNNSQLRARMRKINDKVKQDIRVFFEDEEISKVCPGKKDCLTKKKIKKQKRIMTDTLQNLHKRFLSSVDYKIGYTSFCSLKPFWIVSQKVEERDTCLCATHASIEYLIQGLFRAKIIAQRNSTELISELCCNCYSVECLQRRCGTCKDFQIPYLVFDSAQNVISYYKWVTKREQYINKNGKKKVASHVVKEKISVPALNAIDTIEIEIVAFLYHQGIVAHQFRTIRDLKKKLGIDEALIHCDFSENYAVKYAEEIQSVHFGGSRKQITLHTSQIYFRKSSYEEVSSKSMCTLSQSLDHGPAAVWAHLQPIFEFLKKEVPRIKKVHFLSDSPTTQYRNRFIFYLISHALNESLNVDLATWNYSAAGHGKGAPDGVGAVMKRTADGAVVHGQDMTSFECIVTHLKGNTRKVGIHVIYPEDIELTEKMFPPSIPPFPGTMKVQQVVFSKDHPKKLTMRTLSCLDCFDCDKFFLGSHEFPDFRESSDDEGILYEVDCVILPEPLHLESSGESTSLYTTPLSGPSKRQSSSFAPQPSTSSQYGTVPETNELEDLSLAGIMPGTFVLAKFDVHIKKKISNFRYVCCVEKNNEDNSFIVNGLRRYGNSNDVFVMKDNDTCLINGEDIIKVLPTPKLLLKNKRNLVYDFNAKLDVKEK